jgi:transposase
VRRIGCYLTPNVSDRRLFTADERLSRGLLTVWRRKFSVAAGARAAGFVPVQIGSESGSGSGAEAGRFSDTRLRDMAAPGGRYAGSIEIEMSGARIRVERGVDAMTLATVLSVLRGGR